MYRDIGREYEGLPSPFKRSLYAMIIKSKDIIFFELVYILYTVFVGFMIKDILLSLIFFIYSFFSTFKRKLGFCIIVFFF